VNTNHLTELGNLLILRTRTTKLRCWSFLIAAPVVSSSCCFIFAYINHHLTYSWYFWLCDALCQWSVVCGCSGRPVNTRSTNDARWTGRLAGQEEGPSDTPCVPLRDELSAVQEETWRVVSRRRTRLPVQTINTGRAPSDLRYTWFCGCLVDGRIKCSAVRIFEISNQSNSYFSIRFDSKRAQLFTIYKGVQENAVSVKMCMCTLLLLTMVQVLYLLEVFILAHYGLPSTETPTTETTTVPCHRNSWIYFTSTYYWWLLRLTITIRFDSKGKKHYSHSTN